jgi:hypothetical protein
MSMAAPSLAVVSRVYTEQLYGRTTLADPDRAAVGKAAAEDTRRRFTSGIMAKHLAEIALSI